MLLRELFLVGRHFKVDVFEIAASSEGLAAACEHQPFTQVKTNARLSRTVLACHPRSLKRDPWLSKFRSPWHRADFRSKSARRLHIVRQSLGSRGREVLQQDRTRLPRQPWCRALRTSSSPSGETFGRTHVQCSSYYLCTPLAGC